MEPIMSDDLFLRATKARLRFPSKQGDLTTEDLWSLPLSTVRSNKASLESIGAVLLEEQSKLTAGSILVASTASPKKQRVDLQVAVVRKVAAVRQAEAAAKAAAAARKSEAEALDEIIRDRELKETSVAELKARRAALG